MKKSCQIFRSAQNFGRDYKSLNQSENKSILTCKRRPLIALALAEKNCQFAHSVCKFGRVEDAQYNYKAFTLAEVLITLAIIGVVSALVIPSVLKNYNDKKYNTARLKALKTFGEAGKLASINGEINGQPTAKDFVNNVLSKYLKITKVCDNDKASECNFPEKIQPSNISIDKMNSNDLKAWNSIGARQSWMPRATHLSDENLSVYVMTNDGFSAKIFYNPKCVRNSHEYPRGTCNSKECSTMLFDNICMNVIYDMNGIKEPNHAGEDIGFVTTIWSGLNATSAAPGLIPFNEAVEIFASRPQYKTLSMAISACASKGSKKAPYTLPTVDELMSLFINTPLTFDYGQVSPACNGFGSSSLVPGKDGYWWYVGDWRFLGHGNINMCVWCVRR